MNWYVILQSVITWVLTGFSVSCFAWAAHTSKRITILEEHDKAQQTSIETQTTYVNNITGKLDEIVRTQAEMSTKLDLILTGKVKIGE